MRLTLASNTATTANVNLQPGSGSVKNQKFPYPRDNSDTTYLGGLNQDFLMPQGVESVQCGLSYNPDIGLDYVFDERDLIPDEEIVAEANSILVTYGHEPISRSDILRDVQCIESEVGDDEETLSNNKAYVAIKLVLEQKLGIKVSWDDTSISKRFGNFAEDLIILPDGYGQTYLNSRKSGEYQDMSYLDVPKIRLAIDIRPMRMDHSSTNDGKASMIGKRQAWIDERSNIRGVFELFNLFQDINLGIHRDQKFAYLPETLGGYGKSVPFGEPENLDRFIRTFKQGSHSHLIRDVVRRGTKFLQSIDNGSYPEKDPLLSHVVRFQSGYHDWIKGHSIYAPTTWVDIPEYLGRYTAGRLGVSSTQDEAIARLLSEDRLVTETTLSIHYEHNELCTALLGAENIGEFKTIREKKVAEWRKLSMFSLESYGYVKEIKLSPYGNALTKNEVREWLLELKKHPYNLKTIFREETVYWREALDAIYGRGPMKVPFSIQPRVSVSARSLAYNRRYHVDVVDTEDIFELDLLEDWLRNPEGEAPRKIVNDDNFIIEEISKRGRPSAIVTDDRKLCIHANAVTGIPVIRVPVEWHFKSLYFGEGTEISSWLGGLVPNHEYFEDEGSIKSFEETRFRDGVMLASRAEQKFNFHKPLDQKDKVVKIEEEDFSFHPNIRSLLFDRMNILGLTRRYKPQYQRRR